MKWFTKKSQTSTEIQPSRPVKSWRNFVRTLKFIVWSAVIIAVLMATALTAIGAFFVFSADQPLAYVVVPGEEVTVAGVMPDHIYTSWRGRSHLDPQVLVRKANGWERNFSAKAGEENFQVGDRLVMTTNGKFAYVSKPLPRMASAKNSGVVAVPYEDTEEMEQIIPVPTLTPDSKMKKSEAARLKWLTTPNKVASR